MLTSRSIRRVLCSAFVVLLVGSALSAQRIVLGHIDARRYMKGDGVAVLLNKLPATDMEFLSLYAQMGTRTEGMPSLLMASLSIYPAEPSQSLKALANANVLEGACPSLCIIRGEDHYYRILHFSNA